MTKPIIAVGALGGTIAMTAAERGGAVSPGLDAAGLVAAVPDLEDIAEIRARTIRNVASPSIVVEDVLEALAFRDDLARARGVWLLSSGRIVAPVTHIDGADMPVSPLGEALTDLLTPRPE